MCKDCFLREPRVIAFAEWKQFATLLAAKVAAGQLLEGAYVVDYLRGKEDATQLYICTGCQQRWWVREPWLTFPLFPLFSTDYSKRYYMPGGCYRERLPFWSRLFSKKEK